MGARANYIVLIGLTIISYCIIPRYLYLDKSLGRKVDIRTGGATTDIVHAQGGEADEKVEMDEGGLEAVDEDGRDDSELNIGEGTRDIDNDWKSQQYCTTGCRTREPCTYTDEVDFRIILLGATRAVSIKKSLEYAGAVKMFGGRMAIEIWIDRLPNGSLPEASVAVANDFSASWTAGRACVHTQTEHAYIANQWVYSYRPWKNTSEIGLIIEDDLDVSPLVYKWLKRVHGHYGSSPEFAGATLKSENVQVRAIGSQSKPLRGPRQHPVFMYPIIACWGYSPKPSVWRAYQDFYTEAKTANKNPNVGKAMHGMWYFQHKRREGTPEGVSHDTWHVHYSLHNNLFTIYSNLPTFTGRRNVLLSTNRQEDGLHYSGRARGNHIKLIYPGTWKDSFVDFPAIEDTVHYDIFGEPIDSIQTKSFDLFALSQSRSEPPG